jgi:methionyl-tRNA formyltransferase
MAVETAAVAAPADVSSLRVAFFGSAPFSVPVLAELLEAGHAVVAVYTQPPRPAGRGYRTRRSPVQVYAESCGLCVRTPKTLRHAEEQRLFAELGLDAAVVAAYGLILPKPILAAPRLGCLNVHASLLPRWRGAAPIERAILAGDHETGISIMQMDSGLDTGPILLTTRVPIGPETTAAGLHNSLADLGAQLLTRALAEVAAGTLRATPQPDDGATYARKLEREEGRLDWTNTAEQLDRVVRALNPQPGVWFEYAGERIKVLAAEVIDCAGRPGHILDEYLTVSCGEQAFRPRLLQRPGRAPMETAAFLRGYPLPPGTQLG